MFKCDTVVMMNVAALPLMKKRNAIAWKNLHQEMVGEAKHRAPPPPAAASGINYSKGHNMESINPGGVVNVREEVDVNPNNIDLDVFTTSGYGGYLEVGTPKGGPPWRIAPRPYIFPAVEVVMQRDGARILGDSIG